MNILHSDPKENNNNITSYNNKNDGVKNMEQNHNQDKNQYYHNKKKIYIKNILFDIGIILIHIEIKLYKKYYRCNFNADDNDQEREKNIYYIGDFYKV